MDIKKLNFKQPKYIVPIIALPFILFLGYQFINLFSGKEDKKEVNKELSTSLGNSNDSILSKNDAYDAFFDKKDNRTMINGLSDEEDSLNYYSDDLSVQEKRKIDSLKEMSKNNIEKSRYDNKRYYEPPKKQISGSSEDRDFQRSADVIRMLNQSQNPNNNYQSSSSNYQNDTPKKQDDPIKNLKAQLLVMDSLEKSKDPQYQAQLKAEQKLKANREKLQKYLNSTLRVSKAELNPYFNTVTTKESPNYVKAIIDENIKGYLESRIRMRILEDVYVGKYLLPAGTLIYGNITGFSAQRVNLNIVSILFKGEILPINLTVFDIDGQRGLYIPNSTFREMTREMGVNSVQGMQLESTNQSFFTTIGTKLFSSASTTLANIIRKNKAKLKYNSFIYLINEKELKEDK